VSGSAQESVSPSAADYDAVIVGASLAGCSTAILLARAGVRVALVDKHTKASAFKRLCGHYIQPSAVSTIERLGVMDALTRAGAVRSRPRLWTEWGRIDAGEVPRVPAGMNLRREVLDPLLRQVAAETHGVDLILDRSLHELVRKDGRVCGAVVRDRQRHETTLRAPLVVGADGRGSRVARAAGLSERTEPNGRFSYAAYFEGPPSAGSPDCFLWMLNPEWAGAFPTDQGLTMYACMPTKDRIPEFRRDPEAALKAYIAALPEAPPIEISRQVGPTIGSLDIPIIEHDSTSNGVALVGDAALAADPMFAVGCSWALQSGEWLADSVAPALLGKGSLDRGLARYRRRRGRATRGHCLMMRRLSTTRPMPPRTRLLFAAASHDHRLGAEIEEFSARSISPVRFLSRALARALIVSLREAISSRIAR
jgi:menaquinone-9 beta-reductase